MLEPRIISFLPTNVINLVINDNSLEILYVDTYSFDIIHDFYVGDFNIYSDRAPIFVSLMKQYSINKCTC